MKENTICLALSAFLVTSTIGCALAKPQPYQGYPSFEAYHDAIVREFDAKQAEEEKTRIAEDKRHDEEQKAGIAKAQAFLKGLDEDRARTKADDDQREREGRTRMDTGLFGEGVIEGSIIQIMDKDNMLVSVEMHDNHVETGWLTGYPTEGDVDGQKFYALHVIVDGTKRYDSAFGARTVPLLKWVSRHEKKQ